MENPKDKHFEVKKLRKTGTKQQQQPQLLADFNFNVLKQFIQVYLCIVLIFMNKYFI